MLEQLGEFQVKKKLGEGGMGAVYLAYQESLDRDVALKVLTERLCQNETFIARFKREARSAASILHPNVIQIYSIGEDQGIHYFAMEYVRGKDLTEHLAEGREFTVDEIIDIVMQVAEACESASESAIVHRDIKPANIMLTERGLVKVTDYGLAKTISSELDVTEAGTIVGTANYMSPEQGQGKPLDVRSDIYSLGVVFFELLAGRIPFIADQPSAVLYMHVYEAPPPPSQFNQEVSPALDRMVLRMLAKDPDDRPESAKILLDDLRTLQRTLGNSGSSTSESSRSIIAKAEAERAHLSPLAPASVPESMQAVPTGALTALVVDDVTAVRTLYLKVLTEMGFSVLEAENGKRARDLWKANRPALILLDINMPEMNGLELLAERDKSDLGGEVIVISANKTRQTVIDVANFGVTSYLTKPVNIIELRLRIEKLMTKPAGRIVVNAVAETMISTSDSTSRQVLVYDPSAYSRSLYRGILESLGHQAACVESAGDVYAILEQDLPDLLVLAITHKNEEGLDLLLHIQARRLVLRVVSIIEEINPPLQEQVEGMGLGPVLTKPVRLGEFRNAVEKALAESKTVNRPTLLSTRFSQIVEKQLAKDQQYSIFDFARELSGMLPEGARKSFENRLQSGSIREIQTAISNLLRRLKSEGKTEVGMRYVKNAYAGGNLEVRNFCLALLPQMLGNREEVEALLKIITDEDFRIRCQTILRLGELQNTKSIPIIVRFLNDDVWKVRKEAASALERFDLSQTLKPLLQHYGNAHEPMPDTLRHKLLSGTSNREIGILDEIARNPSADVKAFVATFFGDLRSKLGVRSLQLLLRDTDPQVRAAAARASGKVKNNQLRDTLFTMLTDNNSEVQNAVIEGLHPYPLTPAAAVYLEALAKRGKLIPKDAVRLLVTLNQNDDALAAMLASLAKQSAEVRKYMSLLIAHVIPGQTALQTAIRKLNATDKLGRQAGRDTITRAVRQCYQSRRRAS